MRSEGLTCPTISRRGAMSFRGDVNKTPGALQEHFRTLLSAKRASELPIEREPLFIPVNTSPREHLATKHSPICSKTLL